MAALGHHTIQSKHLLGNPRYTLRERLLANLTDLRFLFGFCLARKNGFESIKLSMNFSPKHRSNSRTLLAGLSRQFPAKSESR